MRKKKPTFQYKKISLMLLSAFFVCGLFLFVSQKHAVVSNTSPSVSKEKKTFYPTQYSDTHITQNAIVSDPRFKNITMADKSSFLSNVVSSVKNTSSSKSGVLENGTWLWTPLLTITPEYRSSIISGAFARGVRTIYLSIDSYLDVFVMPDGPEKEKQKKEFSMALEDFIVEAGAKGITVDAEAGWQNWAEEGNAYKAFAVVEYAVQFNKTHTVKLRGFQYDIEPYMLESYKKNKSKVLYNFVNLVDQTVDAFGASDLDFSVVIPDFYDSSSTETPQFSYKGTSGYTFDHLLSMLDRRQGSAILIMSYRNFSLGDDGSVDISKEEITEANNFYTKIVVAQETGDVMPPYVTFHNTSRSYYNKQVKLIQNSFVHDKSFGGVATHYANAFLELK